MILEISLAYLAGCLTILVPRAVGQTRLRYKATRCGWCGGPRTVKNQPVCKKCLPNSHDRAAPQGWPVATWEDP